MLLGSVTGSASAYIYIRVAVLGKFHILSKCFVTFPAKDSACFQQACRENALNLIFNHCRAGNSSKGDTGCCWMLFLTEGYSSFPPFFLFFPPFSPSCHYKSSPFSPPRHQASRRTLPLEETQRSIKEKKEEVGWSMWRRHLRAGGAADHAGIRWAGKKMGVGEKMAQQCGADWIP